MSTQHFIYQSCMLKSCNVPYLFAESLNVMSSCCLFPVCKAVMVTKRAIVRC